MKRFLLMLVLIVALTGTATAAEEVCISITAQNTFTDTLVIEGPLQVSVEDTSSMSMTITLQRLHYATGSYIDVTGDITEEGVYTVSDGGGATWRVGCKTGDYTSGTASVCLLGD